MNRIPAGRSRCTGTLRTCTPACARSTSAKCAYGKADSRFKPQEPLIDVQAVVELASSFGPIAINRAYCNWQFFGRYRDALLQAAVELIQLFPRGVPRRTEQTSSCASTRPRTSAGSSTLAPSSSLAATATSCRSPTWVPELPGHGEGLGGRGRGQERRFGSDREAAGLTFRGRCFRNHAPHRPPHPPGRPNRSCRIGAIAATRAP